MPTSIASEDEIPIPGSSRSRPGRRKTRSTGKLFDNKVEPAFRTIGGEALHRFSGIHPEPIMIRRDINVPGMDGIELLPAMRRRRAQALRPFLSSPWTLVHSKSRSGS